MPKKKSAKPKQLLNEYRQNFNMMLAEAVAHRVGAMATTAGLPKECIGLLGSHPALLHQHRYSPHRILLT